MATRRAVAIAVHDLGGGGVQRVMCNLARGFVEAGEEVHLLTPEPRGSSRASLPPAVRVHPLSGGRFGGFPGFIGYLRTERPRALISAVTRINLAGLAAARLAGSATAVVLTKHIPLSVLLAERGADRALVRAAIGAAYPAADAIVAVSNGVADDLSRTAGIARERIRVIPNPVIDPDLISRSEAPVDHPWFRPEARPVVLGIGRLAPQKDFETLLRAFASLRTRRPARLAILGEGERRPHLEALADRLGITEDLWLPGHVDNPYRYLRRAAAFALSSRFEGLPTVLIEALAVGTRVVSTDCPAGPREILHDGAYGRLVGVADHPGLAAAIEEALEGRGPTPPPFEALERYTLAGATASYSDLLQRLGDETR